MGEVRTDQTGRKLHRNFIGGVRYDYLVIANGAAPIFTECEDVQTECLANEKHCRLDQTAKYHHPQF